MPSYLYCLTNRLEKDYGDIGVDNNRVFSVIHEDVAAVVHTCGDSPYESKDVNKIKGWILAHNNVIETVIGDKWVVVPFSFDTIIRGDDLLKNWLSSVCSQAKKEFERLDGRLEYAVDIYLKPSKTLESKAIKSGTEYLLKKREENLAWEKLNIELAYYRGDIKENIKNLVTDIRIAKPRGIPEGFENNILVCAFSCLADKDELKGLGKLLSDVNKKGFLVRFTGPWPPYSFVNDLENGDVWNQLKTNQV